MSESPCNTALQAAQKYLSDGFSIIPLIGGSDSDSGKRPPIRWQPYQQHAPTPDDLNNWHSKRGLSAYGVVCGRVSRLAVLDLDNQQIALDFALRFPHLMQTLVVRSGLRGTPHIYWHVDFHVKTQPVRGGDLKGEGSYVVGAGSSIAGGTWTVISERPIRSITPEELAAVLEFLTVDVGARHALPSLTNLAPIRHANDFAALYHRLAATNGRNNALFAAARAMRDEGYTAAMSVDTLAQLHAQQSGRVKEHQTRRHAEARRTIASAYSRPPKPRPAPEASNQPASRIPNHLREALLHRPDGVALLRFIEGMFVRGARPGSAFTEPEARQRLSDLVGRHSILRALQAVTGESKRIFVALPLPLANPTLANADFNLVDTTTKNAFCQVDSAEQKSHSQKPASRPPRHYHFPSVAALCEMLGVQARGSDPVYVDDLASPTRYRQSLHREFIKRRPGQYSQRLLGGRIGVSARTIRRYNRDIPINVQACYHETRLYWHNLNQQVFEAEARRYGIDLGGRCLQDQYGNRFPARRAVAEQLLSWGREVTYKVQTLNYYWYGDARPLATLGETWWQDGPPPDNGRFNEDWREAWKEQQNNHVEAIVGATHVSPVQHALTPTKPARAKPNDGPLPEAFPHVTPHAKSARYYQCPLEDKALEKVAQSAYEGALGLSAANARRLAMTYGARAVNMALRRLQWLLARDKITNAPGFMLIAVPSCWREQNPDAKRPRFVPQPKRQRQAEKQRYPAEKESAAKPTTSDDFSGWFSDEPTDKRDLSGWLEWAES
ncbi:MAG: bifunctional DNA primase/polymerase [Burkholderiales bacterium]|nr:bifunctional DNA primase/polymerase [Anaerolineae bacterium]